MRVVLMYECLPIYFNLSAYLISLGKVFVICLLSCLMVCLSVCLLLTLNISTATASMKLLSSAGRDLAMLANVVSR